MSTPDAQHQETTHRRRTACEAIMLTSGCVMAGSLVLPWFQVSGRRRSTIDVISSASALEVLDGAAKLGVLTAWVTIPLAVAAGLAGWAVHRMRASTWCVGLAGTLMVAAALTAWRVSDQLSWGWWVSSASGVVVIITAITSRRLHARETEQNSRHRSVTIE